MRKFPGGPRRPRPFPRRPVRWIDGNSNPHGDECEVALSPISCIPGTGRELVSGALDLDWADKTEVTVERLVGSISVGAFAAGVFSSGGVASVTLGFHRFGILVQEETDSITPVTPIDLFDTNSLEQYEWMWLHQFIGDWKADPVRVIAADVPIVFRMQQDIPIDLHVRRKMGRRDHLILYRQFAVGVGGTFDIASEMCVQLRCLVKI